MAQLWTLLARTACLAATLGLAGTTIAQVEQAAPRRSLLEFDQCHLELDEHTGCGKACHMRRLWEAQYGYPTDQGPSGDLPLRGVIDTTDVLHCDLAIEVVPSTEVVSGTNVMTIESLVDGLTSFAFRLRNQFSISACTVTDSAGSYNVTPSTPGASSYGRTINFLRPIDAGEQFTVSITYSGVAVARGFGSITFGTQGGDPIVATLSEPYFAATWWPCKDGDFQQPGDNGDKYTMTMAITAPTAMRSVSNGVLEGIDVLSGSRRRHRWATDYPIATYLVAFCSTVYNTFTVNYEHGDVNMPVEFNLYPGSDTPGNRAAWAICVPMLHAFRPLFGEYPFVNEKYGIYQFPFGGGMEHQTNTGQGTFDESVTAHELGHQWWGDMVTCKTWHDIWLNEGFATYSEALWFENKPGSGGPAALHGHMANRRPGSVNGTVYCFDVTDPNRIFSSNFSYRKAGWVLHMLRKVVGDATFFEILAEHRTRHEFSAATTADFIDTAGDVAGEDLSWFFNPWVYQPGAPTYQYGWQAATIAGQPYARLRIRQTQSGTYPLFPMPIEVRVTTTAGNQTFTVFNDAATQHFLLPLSGGTATGITLDPSDWILNEGKSQVAYVAGPPKLVSASPAPGAVFAPGDSPIAVTITFSDAVTAGLNQFTLTGESGPVTLAPPQGVGTGTYTLQITGPVAPGAYTMTVSDAITAGGLALDGEIADPASGPLPSGNGVPGGSASWSFVVEGNPPCAADIDNSGSADVPDIFAYLSLWFAGDAAADIDDIPGVGVPDIFAFLSLWFAGC